MYHRTECHPVAPAGRQVGHLHAVVVLRHLLAPFQQILPGRAVLKRAQRFQQLPAGQQRNGPDRWNQRNVRLFVRLLPIGLCYGALFPFFRFVVVALD